MRRKPLIRSKDMASGLAAPAARKTSMWARTSASCSVMSWGWRISACGDVLGGLLDQGPDDGFLVREVPAEGARRDVGSRGDLVHRGVLVALLERTAGPRRRRCVARVRCFLRSRSPELTPVPLRSDTAAASYGRRRLNGTGSTSRCPRWPNSRGERTRRQGCSRSMRSDPPDPEGSPESGCGSGSPGPARTRRPRPRCGSRPSAAAPAPARESANRSVTSASWASSSAREPIGARLRRRPGAELGAARPTRPVLARSPAR